MAGPEARANRVSQFQQGWVVALFDSIIVKEQPTDTVRSFNHLPDIPS